jgi:hypothetical protein
LAAIAEIVAGIVDSVTVTMIVMRRTGGGRGIVFMEATI